MAKTGRPRKEINYDELKKLCGILCTEQEIADWFEVSIDTLNTRIKEQYHITFSEYYKKNSAYGKISLRRNQFKLSEKSAGMAIWLGKQYLGQRDIKNENDDTPNWTRVTTIYGMADNAI